MQLKTLERGAAAVKTWLRYVFCQSSLTILLMSDILDVWNVSSAFSSACTKAARSSDLSSRIDV